jgi:hypothetical protein
MSSVGPGGALTFLFVFPANPQVTGEPMGRIVFEEARGLDGLKEAKLTIKPGEKSPFKMFEGPNGDGITLNIAVANGLGNAKKVIKVSKCWQPAVELYSDISPQDGLGCRCCLPISSVACTWHSQIFPNLATYKDSTAAFVSIPSLVSACRACKTAQQSTTSSRSWLVLVAASAEAANLVPLTSRSWR